MGKKTEEPVGRDGLLGFFSAGVYQGDESCTSGMYASPPVAAAV